jgi:uncharacterized membrane protein
MEDAEKLKELKTLTLIVYVLQAAGFVLGGITSQRRQAYGLENLDSSG